VRHAATQALRGIWTRVRKSAGLIALGVAFATLLVLAVWVLPPVLADKGEAENDVRSTLLQSLAGLVLAGGLYFTAQTLKHNRESAARTHQLEREGQITERFTQAIDQIGKDRPVEVRLGGIYALERIARESESDHGPIMEVLTAYVREHAPGPPPTDPRPASAEDPVYDPPSVDVQAVIAVLGRRELGRQEHDLDLSRVKLRYATFAKGSHEGHFEKAIFKGADLERAWLAETHLAEADFLSANLFWANLEGADLRGAGLMSAYLVKANLNGATLTGAKLGMAVCKNTQLIRANLAGADLWLTNLFEADLREADLRGANLLNAILADADLWRAYLTEANLTGTDLSGAKLSEANLTGANLTGATLSGADLSGTDLTGANLTGANLSEMERFAGLPNLSGADLTEADLSGANFGGADLGGARLKDANLAAVIYDSDTTWPEDFDPEAEGAT
jgi:uncharacterized protein YjbI with pentapeptide repeats